jgi:TIR domain
VLVLCMSANAFGSDWAQLESGTFRFRDPLNKERRFLPLRLDDAPIKGSLAQFLYINWCSAAREQDYAKLLEGCRPTGLRSLAEAEGTTLKQVGPIFYIFSSSAGNRDESPSSVFYRVNGESLAKSLCSLFAREYGETSACPAFHHKASALISTEEQLLLDEALDGVAIYDDPDRGIYDPAPSKHLHFRAQCAVRAQKWEELLKERASAREQCGTNEPNYKEQQPPPISSETAKMSADERQNSGLILLMLLAQAYYKLIESTISMAGWFTALDLELNESYLWTVKNITNLLKNHEALQDCPVVFEPVVPDLYPSTIRDLEWEGMVAPDAEQFLSTVQKYVHSKGTCDPEEGSQGWVLIELFRPGIDTAIERAIAYHERMQQHLKRELGSSHNAEDIVYEQSNMYVRPKAEAAGKGESVSVNKPEKRFKIALSFPGERRDFVKQIASLLASQLGRARVLYDRYYEAEFARVDFDTYLQRLYHDQSELIVVFLCADYERKEWCGLEWRAVRDLIKRRETSAIMLLRFDTTEIPGLFSIDGYIPVENRSAEEVAGLILQRLAINER